MTIRFQTNLAGTSLTSSRSTLFAWITNHGDRDYRYDATTVFEGGGRQLILHGRLAAGITEQVHITEVNMNVPELLELVFRPGRVGVRVWPRRGALACPTHNRVNVFAYDRFAERSTLVAQLPVAQVLARLDAKADATVAPCWGRAGGAGLRR